MEMKNISGKAEQITDSQNQEVNAATVNLKIITTKKNHQILIWTLKLLFAPRPAHIIICVPYRPGRLKLAEEGASQKKMWRGNTTRLCGRGAE